MPLSGAMGHDLQGGANGPARAAAGRALGRPDVVSRGRRASQLLMSTELRVNLSMLRGPSKISSEHDRKRVRQEALPVTYFGAYVACSISFSASDYPLPSEHVSPKDHGHRRRA